MRQGYSVFKIYNKGHIIDKYVPLTHSMAKLHYFSRKVSPVVDNKFACWLTDGMMTTFMYGMYREPILTSAELTNIAVVYQRRVSKM